MKRYGLLALIAGVALCAAGAPAWAHHSFAAVFDSEQPITIKGVIIQVRLENPHSWFFLETKDSSGKVTKWAFEAGTPSGMLRNGFKPSTVKVGDEVTVKGLRARDKSQNMGMLQQLMTADGKTYGMFGASVNQ